MPSLVVGEGDRAVGKTPEDLLPGCRQAEAATTQSTQKPSGCQAVSATASGVGVGNVNRGP